MQNLVEVERKVYRAILCTAMTRSKMKLKDNFENIPGEENNENRFHFISSLLENIREHLRR